MSNILRKLKRRMAQDFSFRIRSHANFQTGVGKEKRAFWKHVWKALDRPKTPEPVVSQSVTEQILGGGGGAGGLSFPSDHSEETQE